MEDWEELERVWWEERSSESLSPLPPQFYSRVSSYLFRLRAELRTSEGVRKELLEEELREATELLRELFSLRALKALSLILKGETPPSQGEREKKLFSGLRELLEEVGGELLEQRVTGEPLPQEPLSPSSHELLLVLGRIPRIVGEDLRYYGPFEEGEIVSLPKATAELLVAHRLAKKLHPKRFWGGGGEEIG